MIITIIRFLLSGAWKPVAWALGALGLYVKGRSDANAKADLRDLKAHKKTTERMQDAEAAMGDDPAVLRDSLRKRDPKQR
jgi:hypothetical protein